VNDVVLIQYNEIALKLGHRTMFAGILLQNVRRALDGLPVGAVRGVGARIVVELEGASESEVLRRTALVPGVANLFAGKRCDPTLEAIEQTVDRCLESWKPAGSFRVEVRRVDKQFPVKSPDLAALVGARIVRATRAPVDLSTADDVVRVIVAKRAAYVSASGKVEGCGGLPVSTGGRVLLLLSGGIDSPVAGLRMMRRGCRLDAVHFHSAPYLDPTSQAKARLLAAILARGQGPLRLSMIAFGEIQAEIVRSVPKPLRVVIYRRMMMRIASRIARDDRLAALVTGESLGQVASQTLTNLRVIEAAASCPVLRPLVGMDKLEITRYAQQGDTFEISIIPDQDCCTLFVPKHPSTAASARAVEAAEAGLDLAAMVDAAVDTRVRLSIEPVWDRKGSELAAEV